MSSREERPSAPDAGVRNESPEADRLVRPLRVLHLALVLARLFRHVLGHEELGPLRCAQHLSAGTPTASSSRYALGDVAVVRRDAGQRASVVCGVHAACGCVLFAASTVMNRRLAGARTVALGRDRC